MMAENTKLLVGLVLLGGAGFVGRRAGGFAAVPPPRKGFEYEARATVTGGPRNETYVFKARASMAHFAVKNVEQLVRERMGRAPIQSIEVVQVPAWRT